MLTVLWQIQSILSITFVTFSFGNVWCANGYNSNCSHEYANDMANILGRDFYRVIKDTIDALSKSYTNPIHNPEATTKLVMNIGPGTSGTRSLYIAATQLNITSFHSGASSSNCTAYLNHQAVNFEPLFDVKTMKIMDMAHVKYAWWGDIPAPYFWWNILHRFRDRTIFIMSDFDDDSWLESRRNKDLPEGLTKPCIHYYWTVPVAFHPEGLHFKDHRLSLAQKRNITDTLLSKLNIWLVDSGTNRRYFDAYRRFVRCAIPPEKLLWLRVTDEKSPLFWKKLTTFIGLNLSTAQLDRLIDAGIPYWGTKLCRIGSHGCSFVGGVSHGLTPNLC